MTREELLSLCEQGVVPVQKWRDRDTPSAQEQHKNNLQFVGDS
jgi:hypothetical protein